MTDIKPYDALTEVERLTFAAKAGEVPITFNGVTAYTPRYSDPLAEFWDPREKYDQCLALMVVAQLPILADTVDETMERVFRAAVYTGQLMTMRDAENAHG